MKSYLVILASCLTLFFSVIITQNAEAATKSQITPISAAELTALYADKTWIWKTGGGRFEAKGHRFIAHVREQGKTSIASGRWAVDDNGKLCIFARWTSRQDSAKAATCFGHMKAGSVIYQRRHPAGSWYIFRHAKLRPDDEINELVAADRVSAQYRQFEQTLERRDAAKR